LIVGQVLHIAGSSKVCVSVHAEQVAAMVCRYIDTKF
jgi:hypothetical protein